MKKLFQTLVTALLLILIYINISLLPPTVKENVFERPLYSDTVLNFEISGTVFYKESSQPVSSGYVKALKFDWQKDLIITVDSALIQANGKYTLPRCPVDSLFIMAYGDDEFEDFVPGYHDTTIHWQSSIVLTPSAKINGANINVNRIIAQENGTHHISGRILKEPNKPNDAIENAVIYAKVGTKFKGYGISDESGYYQIDSLPSGDFEIIAERIGYYKDYRYIQIGQFNTDTVNFYLSRVAGVGSPEKRIPNEFILHQNYPNPFNPTTNINFSIPLSRGVSEGRGVLVRLVIYDILGREIAVLVNERLTPGTYEVEWDGSNFSSGIYYYSLVTTEFIETKKMVLIK